VSVSLWSQGIFEPALWRRVNLENVPASPPRVLIATVLATLAACTTQPADPPLAEPSPTTTVEPTTTTQLPATPTPTPTHTVERSWVVGATPLPLRPDGFGKVLPTPPQLVNRRLPTIDVLPPPTGSTFVRKIEPAAAHVLARSTWEPDCPVRPEQLRYLTMSFWGFDGRRHTGEMLVNVRVADDVVRVFERLYDAKFPIEEMRITRRDELDLAPTGDGNNTGAFVCRPARGQQRWSAHAYGLAIDLNPFCNPYVKGDLVLPELASAYVDRSRRRPGMLHRGDAATRAFAGIGWEWGGNWRSVLDLMHFSATGR